MDLTKMSKEELAGAQAELKKKYEDFKAMGLKLDMSRGKPGPEQLDLSEGILTVLHSNSQVKSEGTDVRNYGGLEGLKACRQLFAELLGVPVENVIAGGNSSLTMMYDTMLRLWVFGASRGGAPWQSEEKVRFLCPAPGYDRHFAITELFGIEMIPIQMGSNGPDMEEVRKYVESDPAVKGIWCVPKYSNPTGITYSDDTVRAFAALKPAAKDFRIYWDNAYCVHHLTDTPDVLLNIFDACREYKSEDMVYEFTSTSKISFSGAGIAVIAASDTNMADLKKKRTIQTIGPNKVVQLMHARYFHDAAGIAAHMEKHRALLAPKFEAVLSALDAELAPLGIASYSRPNGGYFISFDTLSGCASRVGELCKKAGVVLTTVGATFPYGKDPQDTNIRIAPSFPPIEELRAAVAVFCTSVRLASLEKLMAA